MVLQSQRVTQCLVHGFHKTAVADRPVNFVLEYRGKVSVMMTESACKPIWRPCGEDCGTLSLLEWPAREGLLVIMATINWGKPV